MPNGPCFECGQPSEYDHHVVPQVRGGTKTVPLCGECHGKAHHRDKRMTSSELTRDALRTKIGRMERVGKIRFGYDVGRDGVTLRPNARQQSAIALIRKLHASGFSLRAIAAELTSRGIPTKERRPSWGHQAVARILAR